MAVRVREMTAEEVETIKRLANSRTAPARVVERARIVWLSKQGRRVPAIAQELRVCPQTVRLWLRRFNAKGLAGFGEERARAGLQRIHLSRWGKS